MFSYHSPFTPIHSTHVNGHWWFNGSQWLFSLVFRAGSYLTPVTFACLLVLPLHAVNLVPLQNFHPQEKKSCPFSSSTKQTDWVQHQKFCTFLFVHSHPTTTSVFPSQGLTAFPLCTPLPRWTKIVLAVLILYTHSFPHLRLHSILLLSALPILKPRSVGNLSHSTVLSKA